MVRPATTRPGPAIIYPFIENTIRTEDCRMDDLLPAIEIETAAVPRYSVIWMHGLGADGSDFEPVVPELGLDGGPGVRFVFPHAPQIAVTCNGGYVMPAWYDIVSLDANNRTVDEGGILASRLAIRRLIERENRRGVPCARIFLAGFSQGGAVAYTTALTHAEALAGVIGLSTYIPTPQLLEREATTANRALPIFAAHGSDDDVVSPELGIRARDFLVRQGYLVEWHEYPMPHSVCLEEVREIGRWLRQGMA
jgi:phospholipase/carboxylesterase